MNATTVAFVSLLTYLVKRSISDPIEALVQTANIISTQQHYSERVKINSYGEIHDLANAMNQMLEAAEERGNKLLSQAQEQVRLATHCCFNIPQAGS